MKFTVIMPCHIMTEEHLQLTKQAVETFGECELIVIDDGSLLGGGYLRSIADTYVKNKENIGYGRSVNKGLKLATGEYIAIANNDIRVSPNWQEVTKEVFKNPKCMTCHFRQTDYDEPFKYGDKIIYEGKERWCHASFFVINRNVDFFLYDEHYRNTYDDWHYFFELRKRGWKQCYTDKAQFQHIHSATIPFMEKHDAVNKENAEYFKSYWGDYAENLFTKEFPDQMAIPYQKGWEL